VGSFVTSEQSAESGPDADHLEEVRRDMCHRATSTLWSAITDPHEWEARLRGRHSIERREMAECDEYFVGRRSKVPRIVATPDPEAERSIRILKWHGRMADAVNDTQHRGRKAHR
jgi:hypothetical protein